MHRERDTHMKEHEEFGHQSDTLSRDKDRLCLRICACCRGQMNSLLLVYTLHHPAWPLSVDDRTPRRKLKQDAALPVRLPRLSLSQQWAKPSQSSSNNPTGTATASDKGSRVVSSGVAAGEVGGEAAIGQRRLPPAEPAPVNWADWATGRLPRRETGGCEPIISASQKTPTT